MEERDGSDYEWNVDEHTTVVRECLVPVRWERDVSGPEVVERLVDTNGEKE